MRYGFDDYGWYTGETEAIGPRTTDEAPPLLSVTEVVGELRANFWGLPGHAWEVQPYTAPVPHQEPPADPVEQLRAALINRVTELRWERETGGITLPGGVLVATTLADQNRITSVVANAELAGVETVNFKALSGWVTASLAQVQGIAAAIALHVQACFTAERTHHEALAALTTLEALQAYDITAGWPEGGGA